MIKVLLVEDDQIAQMFAKNTLNNTINCSIDLTSCGEKAVKLCQNYKYDFILMDIGLDGTMNGYDASIEIKKGRGKNKETPIIIVTANASESENSARLNDIVSYFIVKPLTINVLESALQELMLVKK